MSDWYLGRQESDDEENEGSKLPVPRRPGSGNLPVRRASTLPAGRPGDDVAKPTSESPGRTTEPAPRRISFSPGVVGAGLLRGLPWWLYSGYLVWVAAGSPTGVQIGLAIGAAWVLAGVPANWVPFERWIQVRRLRQPTDHEMQALAVVMLPVAHTAGIRTDRFALRIDESDRVSSPATRGRTLAVTRWSLGLEPEYLAAVVAHELDHHASRSWHLRRVGYWYSLPARVVLVTVRLLISLLFRIPVVGWLVTALLSGSLAAGFARGGELVDPAIVAAIIGWPWLLAYLCRSEEIHADRLAVDLGYGEPLVAILELWKAVEGGRGIENLPATLLRAEPSSATRLKALGRHQRRLGRKHR